MTTNIKYFGEAALAKLIALIKGMDLGDFTNTAGYAKSADVPSKVSDLTNDSGFITSSSVPTKVSDLTNDSGYITSASVPTKVSDLTNDSGFITNASIPTKTSDLTNDSGFITTASIPTVPSKTSDLTNDSGYITNASIPVNVSAFTNDAGYVVSGTLAGYLPTAGGTMTGAIKWSSGQISGGTQGLTARAGDGSTTFGASVTLRLSTASANPGDFELTAYDGVNTKTLRGTASGALLWGTAAVAMVSDLSSYLPLSGGTMSGIIVRNGIAIQNSTDSGNVEIRGATSYTKGAYLVLYGKDHASYPGRFHLTVHNGTNTYSLVGDPADGSLKWKGNEVLTAVGGEVIGGNFLWRNTSTSYLRISGGSTASVGGNIVLRGEAATNNAGGVEIMAHDGSKYATLILGPDSSATWAGKTLVYGAGTHTITNLDAYGYVTSDGKQLTLILPILVKGTVAASGLTALVASVRKSDGGYASPGGPDGESLLPSGVTKTIGIRAHHVWINLVRSAGWNVTNNTLINAFISSVTFTVT